MKRQFHSMHHFYAVDGMINSKKQRLLLTKFLLINARVQKGYL